MQSKIGTSSYVNLEHLPYLSIPELSLFFASKEKPLSPGRTNGPIIRDCYIMQYVHSGCGTLTINDNTFKVQQGQAFMTFPKAVTTQKADKKNPWGKNWVCMYGSKVPVLLKSIGITEESPIFAWDSYPELLDEMNRLIPLIDKDSPFFEFDQAIYGNNFFKLIFKYYNRPFSTNHPTKEKELYVQMAIRFIEQHNNQKITVEDIASHVGLNRTYFASLFKSCTKQSPQEFLLKYKIEKACEYLLNPNSTVANVAFSLGYEPRSFIRLFKQIKGIPPSEYRKNHGAKPAERL